MENRRVQRQPHASKPLFRNFPLIGPRAENVKAINSLFIELYSSIQTGSVPF